MKTWLWKFNKLCGAVADERETCYINRAAHAAFVAGCARNAETYKVDVKEQSCLIPNIICKPRHSESKTHLVLFLVCLTVCVTGAGAGVDSAWEQKKLEARKLLENAADSPASSARFVGRVLHEEPFTLPKVG